MVKLIIMFVAIFTLSRGNNLPNNPCPEFFRYEVLGKKVTGLVAIPFDGLPINLVVEASMKGIAKNKKNMSIDLLNDKELLLENGKSVRYRINFPVQKSIPQLTLIKVNGVDLCAGPKLVLSDSICILSKLKFTHNYYPSKRQKRQEEPEYQAGLLEVMPEGNEYFYPMVCADYEVGFDEDEDEEGEEDKESEEHDKNGDEEDGDESLSSQSEEDGKNPLIVKEPTRSEPEQI